jgi:hypothetical protein
MATVLGNMQVDDDATTSLPGRKRSRRVVDDEPEDMAEVPQGVPTNPLAPPNKKKRKQGALPPQMPMPPQLPLHPPMPIQTRSEHHKEIPSNPTGISGGVSPAPVRTASRATAAPVPPRAAAAPAPPCAAAVPAVPAPPRAAVAPAVPAPPRAAATLAAPAPPCATAPAAPHATAMPAPLHAPAAPRAAATPGLFLPEPGWVSDLTSQVNPELDPRTIQNGFLFAISFPLFDLIYVLTDLPDDTGLNTESQEGEDHDTTYPGGAGNVHDDIYSDGVYSDARSEYWPIESQIPDNFRG